MITAKVTRIVRILNHRVAITRIRITVVVTGVVVNVIATLGGCRMLRCIIIIARAGIGCGRNTCAGAKILLVFF